MAEELKKSQLLTLDEMFDIFSSETYREFRENNNLEIVTLANGSKKIQQKKTQFLDYFLRVHNQPLLYRHIKADELLYQDYTKIEWNSNFLSSISSIFDTCELWLHPLVWLEPTSLINELITNSRIAKERFYEYRQSYVETILRSIETRRILYFADELPESDFPLPGFINKFNLHNWKLLTMNYDDAKRKVLDGGHFDDIDYCSMKIYDASCLRDRISIIAEKRSERKAAELIRLFQKEWEGIRVWDPDIKEMPQEEVESFEMALLCGFNDLLKEWEGADFVPGGYCTYIVPGAAKTRDEIEADLERCAKRGAQRFANLLLNYEKCEYLDFRGESPKEIFEYLQERYELTYTLGNFSRYFRR